MPDITATKPAAGAPIESAWGGQIHDAVEGVQSALVTIPGTTATGTLAVVFPRPYSVAPIVVASPVSTSGLWLIAVSSVSTTGCTLISSKRDGSNVTPVTANWIAVPAG